MADSDGKVPDGDQTHNVLTKVLDSARNIFDDEKSLIKAFSDVKSELDAKVKAVNGAVSAKAKWMQAAESTSSNAGGDYSVPARRGGNGYRASSHKGGDNYRAPSGGGNASGPKGRKGGHPTWTGTTDGTPGTAHWEGNDLYVDTEF